MIKYTIVLYLPYQYNSGNSLAAVADMLQKYKQAYPHVNIRFRIMDTKAVSTHAVYESAYLYCPHKSIMVASRHNVLLRTGFVPALIESITEKIHYYFVSFIGPEGNLIKFDNIPSFQQQ